MACTWIATYPLANVLLQKGSTTRPILFLPASGLSGICLSLFRELDELASAPGSCGPLSSPAGVSGARDSAFCDCGVDAPGDLFQG